MYSIPAQPKIQKLTDQNQQQPTNQTEIQIIHQQIIKPAVPVEQQNQEKIKLAKQLDLSELYFIFNIALVINMQFFFRYTKHQ